MKLSCDHLINVILPSAHLSHDVPGSLIGRQNWHFSSHRKPFKAVDSRDGPVLMKQDPRMMDQVWLSLGTNVSALQGELKLWSSPRSIAVGS